MALASSSRASARATGCPVLVASVRHSAVPAPQAAMRRKAVARYGTVALSARKSLQVLHSNFHNSRVTVQPQSNDVRPLCVCDRSAALLIGVVDLGLWWLDDAIRRIGRRHRRDTVVAAPVVEAGDDDAEQHTDQQAARGQLH